MPDEAQRIDLGFVNAYLIPVGDSYILIDTGIAQQWGQLETQLLRAGCLPDKLKLVIITHGDFDHTGNCARLQRKYQARVAMHPGDLGMVTTGMPVKRAARGMMGRLFLFLGGLVGGRAGFETFQPDILLEDGQALGEYGLAARIIYTPGHTKGSIAVLTEDGQLFVGDTLSNRDRPDSTPFIQDFQELRDSISLLKSLDARIIYPGHGKPFLFEEIRSILT